MSTDAGLEVKPTWRGWIHTGAVPLAVVAGVILILVSATPAAKWAALVLTLSSVLLFGTSAVYHRFTWRPRPKAVLRRIDHSNIFLLIAGTCTPLAVDGLQQPGNVILLLIVWIGAALGIAFRVLWLGAPRPLYVVLYIALGCPALVYFGEIAVTHLASVLLVLAGGLVYVVGAVFYARRGPDPAPGVFGFHELFHGCTVIAFVLQWLGILLLALTPVR